MFYQTFFERSFFAVRSLASVALRTSVNKRLPYHFDYFTIDMNEELSGLSGVFLNDQLDYTNQSLHYILKLYKNQRFPPKAVVLIGHSMVIIILIYCNAYLYYLILGRSNR